MTDSTTVSKGTQYWLLAAGLGLIYVAAGPVINYLQTGVVTFTNRHTTYTGPVAAFEIIAFLVLGAVLVFSSIRNLRK
jgi:hypothetical protein